MNVVGSTIGRETDAGIYLHAGPEIGVASTKAFITQVALLIRVAVSVAHLRGAKPQAELEELLDDFPAQVPPLRYWPPL